VPYVDKEVVGSVAGIIGFFGGLGGILLIALTSQLSYTTSCIICGSLVILSGFLALSLQLDGKDTSENNIILAQKKLLIEHSGSIGKQMLSKNLTPSDCTVFFDMQDYPFNIRLDTDISLSESDKDLVCVFLAPVFNGLVDEHGDPEILVLRRTFDISGLKYGGDIGKDLQNKLSFH